MIIQKSKRKGMAILRGWENEKKTPKGKEISTTKR
jgi:hypothetical protein